MLIILLFWINTASDHKFARLFATSLFPLAEKQRLCRELSHCPVDQRESPIDVRIIRVRGICRRNKLVWLTFLNEKRVILKNYNSTNYTRYLNINYNGSYGIHEMDLLLWLLVIPIYHVPSKHLWKNKTFHWKLIVLKSTIIGNKPKTKTFCPWWLSNYYESPLMMKVLTLTSNIWYKAGWSSGGELSRSVAPSTVGDCSDSCNNNEPMNQQVPIIIHISCQPNKYISYFAE